MVDNGMRILLAGDQSSATRMNTFVLQEAGYQVFVVTDVTQLLPGLAAYRPDLLLLDVSQTSAQLLDLCRRIRSASELPLVLISRDDAVEFRGQALQAGADAYLVAPYEQAELLARVAALLRRQSADASAGRLLIGSGAFTLDPSDHTLHRTDSPSVTLSPIEFRLLAYLIRHAGHAVTTARLFAGVWGEDRSLTRNQVAIVIRRLRRKVEVDLENPRHIKTMRGAGYLFEG